MILTPMQKVSQHVGNSGKIIVATGFEWLPKVQKSPYLVTLLANALSILVTASRRYSLEASKPSAQ